MKKLILILSLSAIASGCQAEPAPVVGVWEKLPVAGPDFKVVARTNFIFTDQKLEARTVFSALQQNSAGFDPVCCIEVVDTTPVDLKAVVAKYKADPEFGKQLLSVKGAKFVYQAQPVDKKDWSPAMKTLAVNDANPNDLSPFTAPVVSGVLPRKQIAGGQFKVGDTPLRLKQTYSPNRDRVSYEFSVDQRVVKFSEQSGAAE